MTIIVAHVYREDRTGKIHWYDRELEGVEASTAGDYLGQLLMSVTKQPTDGDQKLAEA